MFDYCIDYYIVHPLYILVAPDPYPPEIPVSGLE